jgi:hypothetical protein
LYAALQRQNAENLKKIFPDKEYRGLSPNFHIHVSVSELYMPTMVLPFLLEEICGPILGIHKSQTTISQLFDIDKKFTKKVLTLKAMNIRRLFKVLKYSQCVGPICLKMTVAE